MEWLLVIVAAGGAGFTVQWLRARRASRHAQAEELEGVRRLAAEDVTYLGEQLARLDREVGGQVLDAETRVAHRTALECYESAQRDVSRIADAEEVGRLTDTVATGRYALACVEARVAGRPVPERRVVCFFDPRHGPSVTEVLWSRPGHGPRRVPACTRDADRVADQETPEIRMVTMGARTMPYWAAGSAFIPYTKGYFASAAALSWALHPAAIEIAPGTPGHFGYGIGSSGRLDSGGFDGSGGQGSDY